MPRCLIECTAVGGTGGPTTTSQWVILDSEIKNKNSISNSIKNIKYLGVSLTKCVQDLYNENSKHCQEKLKTK